MNILFPQRSLVLLLVLITVAGCGRSSRPDYVPRETVKEGGKVKATQRPYVINNKRYYPIPSAEGYQEPGIASWYGKKFHGRKTANGETYDMHGKTAAHKTLPMNTMLLVKNLENNKTTVVRVNDRGPFVKSRIIDLTYTAAAELDMIGKGTARVEIIALGEAAAVEKEAPPSRQLQLKHADFDKGEFYIQVGSFIEIEDARKLARRFAAQGKDVIIQEFPAAGISLYRVKVFSGSSLTLARLEEKNLETSGFPNALVIAR